MRMILVMLIAIACFGCTSTQKSSKDMEWRVANGKLKVLTTIAMINDIVKQVGGNDVDSISLIQGDLDPHSYELVKGDDEKFSRADIIFYNGLGLEHGLSLRQHLENNPKVVVISDQLLKNHLDNLIKIGDQYDPHIWMDISLWLATIDPIVEALSLKDPSHARNYQERALELKTRMEAVDKKIYHTLQAIPKEKRYLVTSHDAFHYFTRHYLADPEEISIEKWTLRCAAPEGLAPDAQLSVTDLQNIINHIVKYEIPVLFPETNVSKDSLRKIIFAAKEKGMPVRLCPCALYGDSMGSEGYLKMIEHNCEIIARELSQ